MTRYPPVSGQDLVAALGRGGFGIVWVRGSHHVLRHQDGRMTVVPVHGREEIGPGLLTRILRDCQLTRDELQEENDLYIHQIAVDPARQGTGVGSWLLQRIDEVARARGLGGLSLQTAEMAVANIRLYQRHGFEIVRRGPPDHGLDPHTRVYMIKSLQVGSS